MVFKNGKAFEIYRVLASSRETGKLGFVIAKNRRKFETELAEYFKVHDEIVTRYGVPNGQGGYNIPIDRADEYNAELRQYDDMESDIPVCKIDEEGFCAGSLTAQEMYILGWMVAEEREDG